ncbi:MAG TPA: DUF4145 domain-containing protein [Xanthobacteraceae bacterium]|nr:DUF4145 domain-containing protein [Xanthobacteraceae bacterium]
MDGYQFVASIIGSVVSLAWPLALIVCVWLFRAQLAALLPNLRVKHKEWEISFRLHEAEKAAAKLPPTTGVSEAPPTPEEKSRLQQIVKLSPRAAILEVRASLEEAVRSFADAIGMKNKDPYTNYASLIRNLRVSDLIDANTSALLDDLRAVGNSAAHNQSDPTERDALKFAELAERLIWQLGISAGAAKMPPPGPIPSGTLSP